MTALCQPLPQPVAEEMLQVVARAVCDRPGDSGAQRESRTRQMVHATMGFAPRDGLEYMLSTLAFGHFQLILDSMNDVFHGQVDTMKARTKTTIVALDRVMLQIMKELREVRRRPMARPAEDARQEATAPAAAVATADALVPAPDPRDEAPAPLIVDAEASEAARTHATMSGSAPGLAVPASPRAAVPGGEKHPNGPAAAPEKEPPAPAISHPGTPVPIADDEGTVEEHIAAFENAMAAMAECLAEARALNGEVP